MQNTTQRAPKTKAALRFVSLKKFNIGVLCSLLLQFATPGRAQLPPELLNQFNRSVVLSAEATTVLTGDNGVMGGSFSSSGSAANHVDLDLAKFGGVGDVGDPRPLGLLGINWQPRLQGDLGYTTLKNDFYTAPLIGDENKYQTFAIEFGSGARFWFTDHLSLAPTISGIYGHTKNSFTASSTFAQTNYDAAAQAGAINWDVDTWTIVPGAELAYDIVWRRTTITLSSTYTFFHTEDFHTSSPIVNINSDSHTWRNTVDVDVPLGVKVFSRELHVGGYYSWTGLYGDLRNGFTEAGLDVDHVNEIHGRVVLDFLDKLRVTRWIGLGGSYFWGGGFTGWGVGVDVSFKF